MANNYAQDASIHSVGLTADTLIKSGQGIYGGYTVTAAIATAAIVIRDSLTAGAGDIIDVIPIGQAAGSTKARNVKFKRGLFVDFGATTTGTVVVEYL